MFPCMSPWLRASSYDHHNKWWLLLLHRQTRAINRYALLPCPNGLIGFDLNGPAKRFIVIGLYPTLLEGAQERTLRCAMSKRHPKNQILRTIAPSDMGPDILFLNIDFSWRQVPNWPVIRGNRAANSKYVPILSRNPAWQTLRRPQRLEEKLEIIGNGNG